ncbi:MAG: hypothetical protein AMXMBFR84_47500 [Candidatus Hydrogenedentota bacterium]
MDGDIQDVEEHGLPAFISLMMRREVLEILPQSFEAPGPRFVEATNDRRGRLGLFFKQTANNFER